jgi:hypothetical protein
LSGGSIANPFIQCVTRSSFILAVFSQIVFSMWDPRGDVRGRFWGGVTEGRGASSSCDCFRFRFRSLAYGNLT